MTADPNGRMRFVRLLSFYFCFVCWNAPSFGHEEPPAGQQTGVVTNRQGAALQLPTGEDAFFFVVFGDRTGGPAEGVKVLAQAVEEMNLLGPDLVMTVGDLIEGYNQTESWLLQMREYREIMDGLNCAWFPVAGNHDVYWRGPGRPQREHEANYEKHFGPLWYAFEHKNCWFVVLYSDEGDPDTGEKTFSKPKAQRLSPAQLQWLKATLSKAAGAEHVFVFLHHPRWLKGGYGEDWERVHDVLAAAGNVSAVFAGHIHRMRYDGERDGIEYVTLATTGGGQSGAVPEAGYLHHFHIVTVREDRIGLAALPVGELMDVRAITGTVSEETRALAGMKPVSKTPLAVRADGSAAGTVRVALKNPATNPIEVTLIPETADAYWLIQPDHRHQTIDPGARAEFVFDVERRPGPVNQTFRVPGLRLQTDYLAGNVRFSIPESQTPLPLRPKLPAVDRPDRDYALWLDGDDAVSVAAELVELGDGPLTAECWFRLDETGGRNTLISKTEQSEYGLVVTDGVPQFHVFLGGSYCTVKADKALIQAGTWHHLAGVYDGSSVSLLLDGRRIKQIQCSGARRRNELPLWIGAEVDGRGRGDRDLRGMVDAVRISDVARYRGREEPRLARRFKPDANTILLLNMDAQFGPWLYDESPHEAHPLQHGQPVLEAVSR